MKRRIYLRGDIYLADLSPALGSEQTGLRPVVVLQNNIGNKYSPTLIVAGVTSRKWKKPAQPTHCLVEKNPAFQGPSTVLLEQLRTIDKTRIRAYLGRATAGEMLGIDHALRVSLALDGPENRGWKK